MKITLFVSNQARHNYLINLLSNIGSELFVVQENERKNSVGLPEQYFNSVVKKNYFKNVEKAQNKFFGNSFISEEKKINLLSLRSGDLNKYPLEKLSDFLKSDIYVVFGSSYIKGDLAKALIKRKSLNIHMGISPYYRGTDCNFWALYDNNPHLVGATIHMLSEGLDSGPILYHALSEIKEEPFEYTMSTVKSAFHSLAEKIKNETILKIKPEIQNKKKEIRYSKNSDFKDKIIENFLASKIDLNSKKIDKTLYKDPFILKL